MKCPPIPVRVPAQEDPRRSVVRVLVNCQWVDTSLPSHTALLQFLREDLMLTAAKPGCGTGDCGACVVLIGSRGRDGRVTHRAVDSCLVPLALADGCQVITLEGTNQPDRLSPVQRSLLANRAVQCGYCTPGLVMSLTGALLNGDDPAVAATASLCRCTGYQSIRQACTEIAATQFPGIRQPPTADESLPRNPPITLAEAATAGLVDEAVAAAARSLAALPDWHPGDSGPGEGSPGQGAPGGGDRGDRGPGGAALVLGGATDWLPSHPHAATVDRVPVAAARLPALCGVRVLADAMQFGAATTVAEIMADQRVAERWPTLPAALGLFASPSVRNLATVGGNLANASPAADLAVLLLAMGALVDLVGPMGERRVALGDFFAPGSTVLQPGELIGSVHLPHPPPGARLQFDKIARRDLDDVATVSLASLIVAVPGPTPLMLAQFTLAAGGVGPQPLMLAGTSRRLRGQPLAAGAVRGALQTLALEVAPRDDVHGGAGYRRRLLAHLIVAHLAALDPGLDVAACLS